MTITLTVVLLPTQHIVLEIQVFTLGSGQAQKFDGVKPVNGID
jgi:hypothetical protein